MLEKSIIDLLHDKLIQQHVPCKEGQDLWFKEGELCFKFIVKLCTYGDTYRFCKAEETLGLPSDNIG